jgi:hypothetical protein
MIEFKFKTKDKVFTAMVPETWDEVTVRQFAALEDKWSGQKSDMVGLLSAFTGTNYKNLENAKGNLWEPLFSVLSFVFDKPNFKKKPKRVLLNNRYITPPKSLNLETFGQKVMALQSISSEKSKIEKVIDMLTIYLQPAYDGKFNTDNHDKIRGYVMNGKVVELMPFGIFFLRKLSALKIPGLIGLKASQRMAKLINTIQLQVMKNSALTGTPL